MIAVLVSMLVLLAQSADNMNQLGLTGDALQEYIQDGKNKDKIFIVLFKKVDQDDKPLMAANENQKEGIIKRINDMELEDFQKPYFQVVECDIPDSEKVMRKNKVATGSCDKRPVIMVKDHGIGELFNGPLATLKAKEYFEKVIPDTDPAAAGDDAAAADDSGEGDEAAEGEGEEGAEDAAAE